MSGRTSSAKGKTISASVEAELKAIPAADPAIAAATQADERNALEIEKLRAEVEQLKEKATDMRSDRSLRERYANWAFFYLILFTFFCIMVVIAAGRPDGPFHADKEVVVTLVGSTAVAAIGLVGWIARGLFKAPGGDK